jgi:dihydroflavonol-4-reductase
MTAPEASSDATTEANKPALVMGASGFLGGHITRQLCEAGRQVRVMLRESSDTRALDGLNVQRFIGDVTDVDSMRAAMTGVGTVFYNVVDTRSWLTDPAPLYKTNVDGLKWAVQTAKQMGVSRFVFTSSMVTLARHSGSPASEAAPFDWWHQAPAYVKSRVEAEQFVLNQYLTNDFPAVVLCVANTYGPNDYQPTPHGNALWQAARGQGAALDCGIPTVDIRDAATAALLAEQRGRLGERYAIVNEFIQQPRFCAMAAQVLGKEPPKTIPMWQAYTFATIAELINRLRGVRDAKFCRSSMFLSEAFGPMSHEKAAQELGWQPRPLEATVKDTIQSYQTLLGTNQ